MCKFFFVSIHPPLELLPVLGPLERCMMPTLDTALLYSSRAGSDLGWIIINSSKSKACIINSQSCLVSCNWNCDKVFPLLNDWYTILRRDSIHRGRLTLLMKQMLYHQATTAEKCVQLFLVKHITQSKSKTTIVLWRLFTRLIWLTLFMTYSVTCTSHRNSLDSYMKDTIDITYNYGPLFYLIYACVNRNKKSEKSSVVALICPQRIK